MFSDHKSLYFVFHNQDERYFLDSTLCLKFEEWLWLTLRKNEYSHIYFIGIDAQNQPVLTLPDRESFNAFFRGMPRPWFASEEIYPGRPLTRGFKGGELTHLWTQIYADRRNAADRGRKAYVFTMRAFHRFAAPARNGEINQLLARMHQPECRDTIILTGTMRMTSRDLAPYVDRSGILAYISPGGYSLLNEAARSLFRREDGLRFFEELKKRIGGQYIELYLPAYDRLLSMLRCLCFRLDKTWSEDALRLYAMLLQRWLYMNNVRAACPELLTRLRPPYTCKRLYDQLLSNGEADRLSRYGDALLAAAPAPASPEQLLDRRFGRLSQEDLERSHIVMDDPRLDGLLRLDLPDYSTLPKDDKFDICLVTPQDWGLMKRNLRSPRLCPPPSEALEWIAKFINIYKTARECKDFRTMRRSLCVLLYCGRWLYKAKDVDFKDVEAYLRRSEKYFQMVKYAHDDFQVDLMDLATKLSKQDEQFRIPGPEALQRLGEAAREAKRETLNGYRSFLQEQSEGRWSAPTKETGHFCHTEEKRGFPAYEAKK